MKKTLLLMVLPFFVTSTTKDGDDPPAIDRIEEDWRLIVRNADVPAAGPQITTTMSPGPAIAHPDINFNLNYRDGERVLAGGLQVAVFQNSQLLGSVESGSAVLSRDNETITWTQRMQLSDEAITYRVIAGHSTTWGDFGGDDLGITFASGLSDLGEYSPTYSTSKSGIGWQADHVDSMTLVSVRYFAGNTLVSTDSTEKVVHPASSPEP